MTEILDEKVKRLEREAYDAYEREEHLKSLLAEKEVQVAALSRRLAEVEEELRLSSLG